MEENKRVNQTLDNVKTHYDSINGDGIVKAYINKAYVLIDNASKNGLGGVIFELPVFDNILIEDKIANILIGDGYMVICHENGLKINWNIDIHNNTFDF